MAKRFKGAKRARDSSSTTGGDDRNRTSINGAGSYHSHELKRENAKLEHYYKKQNLFDGDDEEFALMMSTFTKPLPSTFRITGHREEAQATIDFLSDFIKNNIAECNVENETLSIPPPTSLSWYQKPSKGAWQMGGDRKEIRSDPKYAAFHAWLVSAAENGDISRQEAVSMIPPLLLDIQHQHQVLDMCAAPGSKTSQIIEYMHSDAISKKISGGCPQGLVIANDADQQRSYLLYHQVRRILSPALIVTNNDGTSIPPLRFGSGQEIRLFDRILADVPCSGDGTLRKNPMLWRHWSTGLAIGLHPLQVRLLEKSIRLLKVGGRMVYSTCSLNPIENEAVIQHVLGRTFADGANGSGSGFRLNLLKTSLEGLISKEGLSTWKVFGKDGEEVQDDADADADADDAVRQEKESFNSKRSLPISCFPLPGSNVPLQNCMRVYPHHQNTGGFFIAIIEKVACDVSCASGNGVVSVGEANTTTTTTITTTAEEEEEQEERVVVQARKRPFGVPKPEGEFMSLDASTDPLLLEIFDHYGIARDGPISSYGFFVRSERDPIRSISVVSPSIKDFLCPTIKQRRNASVIVDQPECNRRMKLINAGVRCFELYESSKSVEKSNDGGNDGDKLECQYRIIYESITVLRPLMTKRTLTCSAWLMKMLLATKDSVQRELFDEHILPTDADQGLGGWVIECGSVCVPIWVTPKGVKAFVAMVNRPSLERQLSS